MFRFAFFFITYLLTYCQSQKSNYPSVPLEENFEQEMFIKPTIYKVDQLVDGDTFWVMNKDSIRIKIRLIGINAPETKTLFNKKRHPFGIHSKQYLDSILTINSHMKLDFDVDSLDQYGRTLAYAYLNDGTFLNEKIIREGYATLMTVPPNVKYERIFYEAQQYARFNNLGIWSTKLE